MKEYAAPSVAEDSVEPEASPPIPDPSGGFGNAYMTGFDGPAPTDVLSLDAVAPGEPTLFDEMAAVLGGQAEPADASLATPGGLVSEATGSSTLGAATDVTADTAVAGISEAVGGATGGVIGGAWGTYNLIADATSASSKLGKEDPSGLIDLVSSGFDLASLTGAYAAPATALGAAWKGGTALGTELAEGIWGPVNFTGENNLDPEAMARNDAARDAARAAGGQLTTNPSNMNEMIVTYPDGRTETLEMEDEDDGRGREATLVERVAAQASAAATS